MPWKETNAVDQRRMFIEEWLKGKESVNGLCEAYGISRKTGYKWIQRFHDGGIANLLDRSRRPHRTVCTVSEEMQERIVQLRKQHVRWGPKKLRAWLCSHESSVQWPAPSTIGELLKKRGMIPDKRRRTRKARVEESLTTPTAPNHVWATDFKGAYRVGGKYCHPLTTSDLFSRYLLKLKPLDGEQHKLVQPVFEWMFQEYGMPYRIRSDNGPPFASVQAPGGLSRLSVWWVRLGITPERIQPGHPEQNGSHERMHRTLKAEAIHPGCSRQGEQEALLEQFRVYYNEERPHESLEQNTPQTLYKSSLREYPKVLPDPEYPVEFAVRRVQKRGTFKWSGIEVSIGSVLSSQEIGVEAIADGAWQLWFGPVYLGLLLDEGKRRITYLKNQLPQADR